MMMAGCGGGTNTAQSSADSDTRTEAAADNKAPEKDFLIGTWFAKECTAEGQTYDPDDIFNGTFYLSFGEDGQCTMAIDQQRALVSWERTDTGALLTGVDSYEITFPDDSETTFIVKVKGIDVLMEKHIEDE